MFFRALLQAWLQNTAKAKVRESILQTAQKQLTQAPPPPPAEEPKPCHLGVVFALGIEGGCFEDLLQGIICISGSGFVAREGGLKGRRAIVMLSGAGRDNAARAAEVLIDGHRPCRVISAGFAGGLSPALKRHDILVADQLQNLDGSRMPIELPAGLSVALERPGVHRGTLLTADRAVRLPQERQVLFRKHGAQAVDMETFAVAEECLRRGVPFLSVRVINDTVDDALPHEVEHLLAQKSGLAQWGAAVGAVWRRPSSVKDLYHLHENALIASGRLAKFLAETCFDL